MWVVGHSDVVDGDADIGRDVVGVVMHVAAHFAEPAAAPLVVVVAGGAVVLGLVARVGEAAH